MAPLPQGPPGRQSAVKSLWDNNVHKKYYLTGGVGSGESSEGFGPNYSLRNNAYCETCSSCGEVFFQWKMHLAHHDATYADLYEQTIYNALYGGLSLDGRTFYYDNPLDANRSRYAWHNCPCCVGNLARTMLMLPTWMYSKGSDGVYVNLFVGSAVTIEHVAGTTLELVQATDYPWKGAVSMTVNPEAPKSFAMKIRVPNRDVSSLYTSKPAANDITSLSVNGTKVTPVIANGYATITPEWRAGVLGGVTVLTSTFADGTPMVAIPNLVRTNRQAPGPDPSNTPPAPPAPPPVAGTPPAPRPAPPAPTSILWIPET